jgi:hypothetical protein
MGNVVKGYVIESNKPSHYLHRTGKWIKYDSPAKAYVWTAEEVAAIVENANKQKLKIQPAKVYPASYQPPANGSTGVDKGIDVKDFKVSPRASDDIFDRTRDQFTKLTFLVISDPSL